MNLSAFILAAGLGERLRPITDHIPKPLLPILGKPVLQSIIDKVSILQVNRIGLNLYHKKEIIKDWISQSDFNKKVELFFEDPVQGTGGALKNAESFLNSSTFLVHNSDILSNIDLKKLVAVHQSSENLITLAVHDYPEFNILALDEEGFLKGVVRTHRLPPDAIKWSAFTGIAVYSPEFLNFLPSGYSSIIDTWVNILSKDYKIGTLDVSGCYWRDIGTPSAYAKAIFDELRKNGETVYIHPTVHKCRDIMLDGYVVIEKDSLLNKGVSIRNCIMLPGSRAEDNSHYENCILSPGHRLELSESIMLGSSSEDDALLIGTGGSDRKYYRVKRHNKYAVLMECAPGDTDFLRHIEYTLFFQKCSIPVPELIEVQSSRKRALFEDLGNLSLYSWLKCPRYNEQIENIYRLVIDMLILMHSEATENISECTLLQKRFFDYEHLRWETSYFIKRFVEGIKNIEIKNQSSLNSEFHRLAAKVDAFPKTVIHRDFQSQNIMITKGETPRLLDYQGARIGPPAYDLVSILWDPYYSLDDKVRDILLDYYMNKMEEKNEKVFNRKDFMETILPCRLQRHMQALGAYGFLSEIKGKNYFLKFVPEGLRLLKEDVLLSKDDYPILYDLAMRL